MGIPNTRPGFSIINAGTPDFKSSRLLIDAATETTYVDLDCGCTSDLILSHKISGSPGTGGYVALWQLIGTNITSVSKNLNVVTITTLTPHGLVTGESVTIEGLTPTELNGTFAVTYIDDLTFSYSI